MKRADVKIAREVDALLEHLEKMYEAIVSGCVVELRIKAPRCGVPDHETRISYADAQKLLTVMIEREGGKLRELGVNI